MLMMCYIYCSSLSKWLFFASSSILFVISLFMLKRGVMQKRFGLRQLAFFMMFVSASKVFLVDAYLLRRDLLCNAVSWGCTPFGFKIFMLLSALALVAVTGVICIFYRNFLSERNRRYVSMEEAGVRLWANTGMGLVLVLILWLVLPWGWYLLTGHISALLSAGVWRYFSILVLGVILTGFWKYEDCNLPRDIQHNKHTADAWKPKDTLWLALVLLIMTMGFFTASDDIILRSGF